MADRAVAAHHRRERLVRDVGAREREQAAYGFQDMCDTIVYSHEVGYLKPEPAAYRIVCERWPTLRPRVIFCSGGAFAAGITGACAVGAMIRLLFSCRFSSVICSGMRVTSSAVSRLRGMRSISAE